MKSRPSMTACLMKVVATALFFAAACNPTVIPPSAVPTDAAPLPSVAITQPQNALTPPGADHRYTPAASETAAGLPEATPKSSPTLETAIAPVSPTLDASLPPGRQLAFLNNGDIWLLDSPGSQPYQLTIAGDIQSYAWSSDGKRLAAFNGRAICLFESDGSIRTACLELGLNDQQSRIARRVKWSPDQRWIVLWNPINPQDEDAIGWLAVAMDNSSAMWRIQDPVDWGASLAPDNEPGGFTGEPVFLADGSLLGTISHRYLCGSGGCRYQLFSFDLSALTPTFTPYPNQPEAGWSEGRGLVYTEAENILTNFGTVLTNCDTYHTYIDRYNLNDSTRQAYTLENQAVDDLEYLPDKRIVLSRTAGCAPESTEVWSLTCGLSDGFEILPMQMWEPETGKIEELVPGTELSWSPVGDSLAFRSCLNENSPGVWKPDSGSPAGIYLMNSAGNIQFVSEGAQPSWKP